MLLQRVSGLILFQDMFLIKNVHIAELSARFKEEGMLAYVQLIQRKEKEIGCDVLTHQKWSVFVFSRR